MSIHDATRAELQDKALREIVTACHENSKTKGWWPEATREARFRMVPAKLMLIVSEAAEALECYRDGELSGGVEPQLRHDGTDALDGTGVIGKPVGFPSELADIVIRVFDLAGALDIDLATVIRQKMMFNATRPYRHGGKVI